jgi:hypothetical protein
MIDGEPFDCEHRYACRSGTNAARPEIAELRGSMSWRATAPLRLVYALLLKAIR